MMGKIMIMILGKGMVNFSIPTETEMYPSENVQPLKFCSIQRKAGGENMPEKKLFTDLRINGLFVGDWWGGWVASRASSKCRRILKNIGECRLITNCTLWGAKDKYGNDHTWIIYTTLHLHCGGGLNIHFITFTSGGRSTLRWRNLSSVVRASSWYPAAFARRADDDCDDSFDLWWYWCWWWSLS